MQALAQLPQPIQLPERPKSDFQPQEKAGHGPRRIGGGDRQC
jgi:hypothetical protein